MTKRRYIRHILVQTEDMAKMCLNQIKEGADFSELASSISDCQATRAKGERCGPFVEEGWLAVFGCLSSPMRV